MPELNAMKAYYEQGYQLKEVAEILAEEGYPRRHPRLACAYAKRYGWTRPLARKFNRPGVKEVDLMFRLFNQGLQYKEIAERLAAAGFTRRSSNSVWNMMSRRGAPRRRKKS